MFGIPVTEYNDLFTTISYENTNIDLSNASAQVAQDFVAENGDHYDILRLTGRFSYDTRNKAIFPDKGMLHRIEGELAVPSFGNPLEFYKISYNTQYITNFYEEYIISLTGNIGYGDGYADTSTLPFFENFFAGGPRSVRGYEDNTLGPRDSVTDRPVGGNIRLVGGGEVILPIPYFRDIKSVRISGFFDAGNVYDDSIDIGELRYSAGISGIWVSPFGIVSASYAQPFNDGPDDDIQEFQFTFGSTF